MTRRIEIWSMERWQKVFGEAQEKLENMGARLAELGL
jgi:DNA-binding transcriptional regulator/RsmH inhibitor MraZ